MYTIDANRYHITLFAESNSPACVIMEIAESMMFKVDKRLISDEYISALWLGIERGLNDSYANKISLDDKTDEPIQDMDNLSNVAAMVNSENCNWSIPVLNKSFKHLMQFYKKSVPINPDRDFIVGRKTPNNPYSYDACMLYKLCLYFKIETNRYSTMEDMATTIKYYLTPKEELIKDWYGTPVHLKGNGKRDIWDGNVSTLKKSYINTLGSKNVKDWLMKTYEPNNHSEAIMFAKNNYNINIFYAHSPVDEYKWIRSLDDISNYTPKDDKLTSLYNRDPSWFDTDTAWIEPLLNIYSKSKLHSFAINEGFSHRDDLKEAYESLMDLGDKNHIYLGIHPALHTDCKVYETIIGKEDVTNINSIEDDIILTIGKTTKNNEMYLTTIGELYGLFDINHSFSLPHSPIYYFNSISIKKLKIICSNVCGSTKKKMIMNKMNVIIEYIEKFMNEVDCHIDRIKKLNNEDQNCIKSFINGIIHLSYYMRGWKVGDNKECPLSSEMTQTTRDGFDDIEANYTLQSIENEELYNSFPEEIKDIIDGIALMIKTDVDGVTKFVQSSSNEIGRTIMDRLNIIRNNENDNSCIRLSSNYLLYSCWYYMKSVFDEEPFNVDQVGYIT